jgi:hypothetical protein
VLVAVPIQSAGDVEILIASIVVSLAAIFLYGLFNSRRYADSPKLLNLNQESRHRDQLRRVRMARASTRTPSPTLTSSNRHSSPTLLTRAATAIELSSVAKLLVPVR